MNKLLTIIMISLIDTAEPSIITMLESSLNADRLACSGELVILTCTTRGSPILEWFSEEYIGTGRDRLQILSESDRNSSSITPDAVAIRINVTTDNGVIVIVSELRIMASIKYPTATVSCSNGDQRFTQNITFRTFVVTVTSTLNAEHVAYSQDTIIFTCTTRGSPILEWFSEEYIGIGRDRLQILSESDRNTSSITPDAVATRINVTNKNGVVEIVSELRIIASIQYPNATVSCSNGSPKKVNVMFQTVERATEEYYTASSPSTFTAETEQLQLTTENRVSDNNRDSSRQISGVIGGIVVGSIIVIATIILLAVLVVIILHGCTRSMHRAMESGPESGQDKDAMKQDLPDMQQESHHEDQEISFTLKMNQGNDPTCTSIGNKRNQVKSDASRLSWDAVSKKI